MAGTFTINLARPISSAKTLTAQDAEHTEKELKLNSATSATKVMQDIEKQKAEVAQLCRTLNCLVAKVNQFYDELLAKHKEEIAKLSVEIANRVLMQKVQKGDYQIESIVKEALGNAPARHELVVHLNPEDLPQCHKLQQDDRGSAFAGIKLIADPSIGRAECLLETPKGIIKSFIDEHMERISEALQKVE